MLLALTLLLAPAPPEEDFAGRAWAEFSRSPARRPERTVVQVATLRADRGARDHVLRRQVIRPNGTATAWADGRSCPAVRPVLEAMRALALPRPDPPGLSDGEITITADGIGYALKAPSSWGSAATMSITSNIGTPLADWVERSLAALEPCWTGTQPR